ncbi:MAG: hypothetical protein JSR82_12300 [Verrucomicrobia bacterium]|nr:hypothetical protein [Verrucomicrobiota bacterium]
MFFPLPWLAQAAGSSTGGNPSLGPLLETLREFAVPLVIWFLLTQSVSILAYWAASRVVNTGESATLGNAIKVYLYSLLAAIIAPILLLVTAHVTGSGFATAVAAIVFLVYIAFAIPMKVYEIEFGRALGWLLLSLLFSVIAGFVLSLAFGTTTERLTDRLSGRRPSKPPPEEASAAATPTPARAPVERAPAPPTPPEDRAGRFEAQERLAADKARPQTERLAALTEMYRQLEQERLSLPQGDATARAAFDQRRARYDAALQKLRAEQPTPRPTSRPAK